MEGSFGKNLAYCTFGTIESQRDAATLPSSRPPRPSEPNAAHQRCYPAGAAKAKAAGVYEGHALR
jgi:hypothetical protein